MQLGFLGTFVHVFFLVPYKDCVELLNAGIRNTGVHIILDKSWALPTYCDQDYMGGGKLNFWRHEKR